MSQVYVVSNSMRAKDRDGNPKVWNSQYGEFEVWNVYFQGDDTKYQVNKKPGFGGYSKGQEVFGTATKGQYGGQFKQEQAPEGMELARGNQAASQPVQSAAPVASGNNDKSLEALHDKVDYLTGMVEAYFQGESAPKRQKDSDYSPTDIDDGPVDLSQLDI